MDGRRANDEGHRANGGVLTVNVYGRIVTLKG
jgi:hypothetical protein